MEFKRCLSQPVAGMLPRLERQTIG